METVSIIGLGKLGAPMAAVYGSKGYKVIGVDRNPNFVDAINAGKAPVDEPLLQDYIDKSQGRLRATLSTEEAVLGSSVTFVIVPTPSGPDGTFTNKYVIEALREIGAALRKKDTYHLVVVTSTVMPGSTNGEIRQALEQAAGKKVGQALGLCYSPEFIALGSVVRDMLNPDFFLIGESDEKAGAMLESIYLKACDNQPRVERMNCVNAELTKISINTYVTTKISYANMLSEVCDYLDGADVDVVTQAVGCDSRIGHKYLKGGVAYGGPCFPRDNVAFSKLAHNLGAHSDLAESTDTINKAQRDRVLKIMNQHGLKTGSVGILGLSYKPGTPVIEESQGISLAVLLTKAGRDVVVFDPLAMAPAKAVLVDTVTYADSLNTCLNQCSTLVLMTAWPEFKTISPELLKGKTVIDCWRVLKQDLYPETHILYLGNGVLVNQSQKIALEA
jgi:UDPglucose 6-dehydrogenase